MKKFEYYQCRTTWSDDIDNELNMLGLKGWELISITQEMDMMQSTLRALKLLYTFKRELIQESEQNLESETIVNDWIDKNLKSNTIVHTYLDRNR